MHISRLDSKATSPAPFNAAISIAAAVLLGLALAGIGVVSHVRMAPSAVPVEMAVSVPADKQHRTLTASTHQSIKRTNSGPAWSDITKHQQSVLAPLRERWSAMSEITKRRWMTVADGFDNLSEEDQAKLRKRMQSWASLSAQQRNQARLNFFNSRHHSADELQAKWAQYQALSEEEKQRLAAKAAPKPKGAAAALRPQSKKKLARVPAANTAPSTAPNLPKITLPKPAVEPVPAPVLPATPASVIPNTDAVQARPIDIPQSATPQALPPLSESAPVEKVQPKGAGQYSHPDFPLVHPPQ